MITVGTKAIETTGTVTETEEVAFETITKYDTNMAVGTEVVETEGTNWNESNHLRCNIQ